MKKIRWGNLIFMVMVLAAVLTLMFISISAASVTLTDTLATYLTADDGGGSVTQSGNSLTLSVTGGCTGASTKTMTLTVVKDCEIAWSLDSGTLASSGTLGQAKAFYAAGDKLTFAVKAEKNATASITIVLTVTEVAVSYPDGGAHYIATNGATGAKYPFAYIDQAVEFTKQSNGTYNGTVIVAESGNMLHSTGSKTITIPTGVTLLLPRVQGQTTVTGASDTFPYANYATWSSDSRWSIAPSTLRYLQLKIPSGTTVNNNGMIVLGGVIGGKDSYFSGATLTQTMSDGKTDGYTHSDIQLDGTLNMGSNSVLSSIGFVTGNGTINTTGTGAKIYQPFVICDFRGGNYVAGAAGKADGVGDYSVDTEVAGSEDIISPFLRYTMQNIQAKINIDAGNYMYGYCDMYASSSHNLTTTCIVGDRTIDGLLRLEDGATLTAKYQNSNKVSHYDAFKNGKTDDGTRGGIAGWGYNQIGRTKLEITGGASLGDMSLTVKVTSSKSVTISMSSVTFPVPYNYDIYLNDGEYNIPYSMMLLPGASMTVGKDATLKLGNGTDSIRFMVMDGLFDHTLNGEKATITTSRENTTDYTYPKTGELQTAGLSGTAVLKLNGGKLVVNPGVNFGGVVQTDGTTGTQIDFNGTYNCDIRVGLVGKNSLNYQWAGATVRSLNANLMGSDGNFFTMQPGKTYYGSANATQRFINSYTFDLYTTSSDKNAKTTYTEVSGLTCDNCATCQLAYGSEKARCVCNIFSPIEVYGEWQECTHEGTTITDAKVAPTCTATGLTEGSHCTACGTVIVEQTTIPATGHSMGDWIVDTEATCEGTGSQHKECANCDYEEFEVIPEKGHSMKETTAAVAPTCTETGKTAILTCANGCGKTEGGAEVAALGHTEEYIPAVAPTCEATGLTEGKKCTVCNTVTVAQQEVPATGHTYTSTVTAPTCTAEGYTTYTCTCGDTYTANEVAALGHNEKTLEAVAPKCEATGLTEGKQCTVCNTVTVEQEVVPAKGHNMQQTAAQIDPSCTADGTTAVKTCANGCGKTEGGEVIPATGHSEVIVSGKEPTCTETGLTDGAKCFVCGEILTAQNEIPAKGHAYTNGFCDVCKAYEPATDANEDGVYEIGNAGQLYWFAEQVNGGNTAINAILTADIVVNTDVLDENGNLNDGNFRPWTPIGNETTIFTGNFDGANHTVSGLYFNDLSISYVGLIGRISGNVSNVGVKDSYFHAKSYVGGVIGATQSYVTVNTCYNSGTVVADGMYAGGIAGDSAMSTKFYDCYNTGSVSGNSNVGGITGNISTATLADCWNSGTITGSSYVGGIIGQVTKGGIDRCYNTGDVTATYNYAGGIVGVMMNYVSINNCWNDGNITGNDSVGGLAGYVADGTCSVQNSYNIGKVKTSGTGALVGAIVGNAFKSDSNNPAEKHLNCYYLEGTAAHAFGTLQDETVDRVYQKTAEQFASGEVTYLLNDGQSEPVWFQTCGEGYPAYSGNTVYLNQIGGCNEETFKYEYANESKDPVTAHTAGAAADCVNAQTCTACGTELVAALGHTAGETVVENNVAADCENAGSYDNVVYCTVCKAEISRETKTVEATGHTEETIPAVDATCTETGLTAGVKCSVCGEILTAQEEIPAKGHTYSASETKAPTCTEAGVKTFTCSVCGDTYTEAIAATGHTLTQVEAKAPTCTEAGYEAYEYCSVCDYTTYKEVAATGHAYESTVTAPTCTADGYTTYTCACGDTYTGDTVAATGHKYESEVTAPTFEADGFTTYTCACGHSYTETSEGTKLTAVAKVIETIDETIVETKYQTLADAIAAANDGDTIVLLQDVLTKATYVMIGKTLDFNGHTLHGNVVGTLDLNGGTLITPDKDYVMAGPKADYYITTNAVLTIDQNGNIIVHSGTMTVERTEWWTGKGQTLTIEKDAKFIISEHTTMQVLSTVIVKGTVEIYGTINLYDAEATIEAPKGLNVTTTAGDKVLYADGKYIVHDHTAGEAATENNVAPNCTTEGSYDSVVYCSVCGDELSRDTVTVNALGHTEGEAAVENEVAATCTANGSYDNVVKCTVCGKELSRKTVTVDKLGHDYKAVVTAPTCTADGYTTYTCSVCGDTYKADEVAANKHSYSEEVTKTATCTEAGEKTFTCSVCGDTYTEAIEATGHTLTQVEAKAPTCTEKGWDAYETCSRCDYTTYVEKAALGHDKVSHEAKAPTCTEIGWDAYETCSRCDYTTYAEKAALSHDYKSDVTAPTCEADGYTTHTCSRCNDTYIDTPVDKLGHDMQKTADEIPAQCDVAGKTAVYTCANGCGKTEGGEEITALEHDMKETEAQVDAKCEVPGKTAVYTCANGCGKTEGGAEIPALSHDMKETEAQVDAKCEVPGKTAVLTCANGCGKTEGGEVIPATGHSEVTVPGKEPTCTETGLTDGAKCFVCGEILTAQEEIPAKGHTYSASETKAPTCTEAGVKTFTCSVCGDTYTEAIAATGHTLTQVEAKAPTCTAIGWDAYETCSRCDYTTYAEKVALGHDKVPHDAKAPTCTEKGWDAYETCSRCDYTTYVEKAALGHDKVSHEAKAPTCTAIGWDAYETCSRCDYTTYAEKVALGHDKVPHDAKAPACTEIGWDAYETCSRCDYSTYQELPATGEHNYKNGECTVCGEKEPVKFNPVSGNGSANTDINTTVDEQTGTMTSTFKAGQNGPVITITSPEGGWKLGENAFTVSSGEEDIACVVIVKDVDGNYKRLSANTTNGVHSFTGTLAEGCEIIVAVKGDADGNGAITTSDYIAIARSLLQPDNGRYMALGSLYSIIGDADGNGSVTTADYIAIARALLQPSNTRYQSIVW